MVCWLFRLPYNEQVAIRCCDIPANAVRWGRVLYTVLLYCVH